MRSGNPVLQDRIFDNAIGASGERTMTVGGTVQKTAFLLALTLGTAIWSWTRVSPQNIGPLVIGGAIAGLVVAIIISLNPKTAPMLSPVYALVEGVVIGTLSMVFEAQYPGIVVQAAGLTFATAFALLGAYSTGMIKVTHKFRMGIVAATGGIFLMYMASMIMGFFGGGLPFLHSSGPIGIGVSLVIVVVAALNLVLDFDFIDRGASQGAPRYLEWYGAFALIVTLIWLYLEMLRLLSKLQRR
ncbi:MAG: Bax inhibitor-1/YccA family protein [Verrucomicrobia bacterium]|nr:Bax inhibitor-1/YccA family protein [Verrucomicrobiota bacterium]MCH8511079.1 Bax inhibitor-1/YccA family protein [Kiritimatiellia bacterium]